MRSRLPFTAALACATLIGGALVSPAVLAPLDAQAPARWRLQPVATIEGLADDPFGTLRGIALHADGRLVVTESKPARVSMFDGTGKSLGVVGRTGGGPGEYRSPYSAVWLADTLAIYDPGESRVAFLANGRTPLRTERTVRLTGGPDVRFFPVSRTRAYLRQSLRVGNRAEGIFVAFGSGKRDTVMQPTQAPVPSGTACRIKDGITFFSWPEAPMRVAFPVRPDGALAVGNTGRFDIAIQARDRTIARVVREDFVPEPLPDAMWNSGNADYRKHVGEYGAASCDATPVRPPHRAPVRAIAVADNGDLWLAVHGKSGKALNVFSPDGRLRATLDGLPAAVESLPFAIAGDRLAVVEADSDGVQTVRILRIVKQ
ncbi:MAG: hypothetical protein V4617_06380 [Gemmatimonadota bacterium]